LAAFGEGSWIESAAFFSGDDLARFLRVELRSVVVIAKAVWRLLLPMFIFSIAAVAAAAAVVDAAVVDVAVVF